VQLYSPFDGPLQAEVPERSSECSHPVQDEVTVRMNRRVIFLKDAMIRDALHKDLPMLKSDVFIHIYKRFILIPNGAQHFFKSR
jgi:hypothetical protein